MYHLKISIPSFRQIQTGRSDKDKSLKENDHGNATAGTTTKGHFVYNIEVGFLGERSQDVQERMARFYFVERRYSAFLSLHHEVYIVTENRKQSQQRDSLSYLLIFTVAETISASLQRL